MTFKESDWSRQISSLTMLMGMKKKRLNILQMCQNINYGSISNFLKQLRRIFTAEIQYEKPIGKTLPDSKRSNWPDIYGHDILVDKVPDI